MLMPKLYSALFIITLKAAVAFMSISKQLISDQLTYMQLMLKTDNSASGFAA